jgi:hypothetical protein
VHKLTSFAHRRNFNGSYDSICTKCFATVAIGEKEEALSPSESTHVCDPSALYLVNQGSIPVRIPTLWLREAAGDSGVRADKSIPIHFQKFSLQTKLRLTVKPGRAD